MSPDKDTGVIPLVEEVLHVDKRQVVTGRSRVRTVTREDEELIRQDLVQEGVEVTRVPVNLEVEEPPIVRQEGNLTIIPVVEEVLFIEKRLVLKEEIHIRRTRSVEPTETKVILRRQEAVVEHLAADDSPDPRKD
jgi:stress response protein YsnF